MNFRAADMQDQDKLISLYGVSFPQRRIDRKWFHWYIGSPYGTRIYILQNGEVLVGAVGYVNIKFADQGKVFDVGLIGSVCTHPEYRGLGFFTKMMRMMHEAAPNKITIGVPNLAAYPGHMSAGALVHSQLEVWAKKPRKGRFIEADKLLLFESSFLEKFNMHNLGFGAVHDARLMNWRIVTHPSVWYETFMIDEQAYVTLKHYKQGEFNKVHIMDLQFIEWRDLTKLVTLAENYAAKKGASLDLWLIDDNLRASFRRFGFEPVERQPLIVYGELGPVKLPARFCYADSDTY